MPSRIVDLPEEQEKFIAAQVASGAITDASEAMRAAFSLLE